MPPKAQPRRVLAGVRNAQQAEKPHGAATKVSKAPTMFDGVHILRYVENGPSPNYQLWLASLQLALDLKYPDISNFLRNNDYPTIDAIELPTPEEEAADAAAGGYGREERKIKMRMRLSDLAAMEKLKGPCSAFIYCTISEESKMGLEKLPTYEAEIKDARDPLMLCEAIELVHSTAFSVDTAMMEHNVQAQFNALFQFKAESLLMYKKRLAESITQYTAIELEAPSASYQVTHMIRTCDKDRYGKALKDLFLKVHEGDRTFPASVHDLYLFLVGRVPDSSVPSVAAYNPEVESVFVAQDSYKPKKEQIKDLKPKDVKGAAPPAEPSDTGKKPPTRPCCLCPPDMPDAKKMHWQSDCPFLEAFHKSMVQERKPKKKSKAYVTVPETEPPFDGAWVAISPHIAAAVSEGSLGPTDMLMDNAATVSVANNPDLLDDIQVLKTPRVVSGVGGSVTITHWGRLKRLGRPVLYCPEFMVSLFSHSEGVSDPNLELDYIKDERTFSVTNLSSGEVLRFEPRRGLYVCDMAKASDDVCDSDGDVPEMVSESDDSDDSDDDSDDSDDDDAAVAMTTTTVEANKLLYTKREVKGAEEAAKLMRHLAYPSPRDLYSMVQRGIDGSSVTVQDLARCVKIFGPNVATIQGKTVRRRPAVLNTEFVPKPVHTNQVLHADLLFVDKASFLISVSEPLGLTIASHLPAGKGTASLLKAMKHQLGQYSAQGFRVSTLVFDGEGAIGAIADDVATLGTSLERVPPGAHVALVERKNRVVQERYRCIKNSLWFVLPMLAVSWLVYFCISRINMLPSNGRMDPTSPRELFTRRKLDYKRDLSISFGDFVHVHEDRQITNTSLARTQEAICLMPIGNLTGSAKFLCLKTRRVITRSNYTVLPVVSQDVIDRINCVAAEEKTPLVANAEPVFQNQNGDLLDPAVNQAAHGELPPGLVPPVHVPPAVDDPAQLQAPVNVAEPAQPDPPDEPMPVTEEPPIPNDLPAVTLDLPAATPEPRYPARGNRTSYKDDRVYNITVKKALNSYGKQALRSIYMEILQMPDKGVFTPQDPRSLTKNQLRKVISSSMFLKEKFMSNGDFEKLKARLVAGGHQQDKTAYDDISSPTVATSAAFMVAALAARERRHVVTVDIAGAYLNADMSGPEVLMRLDRTMAAILTKIKPEYSKFLARDGSMVVRLDKALYGCIESAKLWYEDITRTLLAMGFKRNPVDLCVFNKGSGAEQCTICLHVDDLMITARNPTAIEVTLQGLTDKYKTLTVHRGAVHSYLGMTFDFSVPLKAKITMEGYVNDTLKGYGVTGTAATPATVDLFNVRNSPLLSPETALEFHSRIAKLLYLAKRVRPDILTAIAFLSTRTKCSTADDYHKLDRVLKYLNGTAEFGMVLEADKEITVIVFADASYGVHADGKSHTGVNITLGRGAVFVRSAKQKIVSKSSTEAELIGLTDSLTQAIWTREFLLGQGYTMGPATIYQDNMSAIALAAKGRSTSDRTRHIHIRYFFVKDRVDSGEVHIEYKPTKLMLADILTKPLQGDLFRAMRKELLNWE